MVLLRRIFETQSADKSKSSVLSFLVIAHRALRNNDLGSRIHPSINRRRAADFIPVKIAVFFGLSEVISRIFGLIEG